MEKKLSENKFHFLPIASGTFTIVSNCDPNTDSAFVVLALELEL